MTTARDNAISDIARKALNIETIETRKSDSLDFHDLAVWCIKDALERAYEAGRQAAASDTAKHGEAIDLHRHPMHSASDLRYLRRKGYSDEEILTFWDRDHAEGKTPVHHRTTVTFEGIELSSAGEALQHANADSRMDTAILFAGKHFAVAKSTAEDFEARGLEDQRRDAARDFVRRDDPRDLGQGQGSAIQEDRPRHVRGERMRCPMLSIELGDENLVPPEDGCPVCDERDADRLVWIDDETVRCARCGHTYEPQGGDDAPTT